LSIFNAYEIVGGLPPSTTDVAITQTSVSGPFAPVTYALTASRQNSQFYNYWAFDPDGSNEPQRFGAQFDGRAVLLRDSMQSFEREVSTSQEEIGQHAGGREGCEENRQQTVGGRWRLLIIAAARRFSRRLHRFDPLFDTAFGSSKL